MLPSDLLFGAKHIIDLLGFKENEGGIPIHAEQSNTLSVHFDGNEMNVNIVTYINNIRLEHAVSMMHDKTYDLKYIAQLCGFKTYRNFYNNFVKRYKIPPTEYLCLHDDEVFTVLVD